MELAVERSLKRLTADGLVDGRDAHCELALTLAQRIDRYSWVEPGAGMASLARELRATIEALEGEHEDGDGDVWERLSRELSAEVGDQS